MHAHSMLFLVIKTVMVVFVASTYLSNV